MHGLPEDVQHEFSVKAIKEGLPKSSVEVLVAAFNAPNCPDAVKQQIVENPRQALLRLSDIRTAKPIRQKQAGKPFTPANGFKDSLIALRQYMADFAKHLYDAAIEDMSSDRKLLKELRDDAAALLVILDDRLKQLTFSPGKNVMGVSAYGN